MFKKTLSIILCLVMLFSLTAVVAFADDEGGEIVETQAQPEPEVKAEPEPEVKTEPEPEVKTEPEAEVKTEPAAEEVVAAEEGDKSTAASEPIPGDGEKSDWPHPTVTSVVVDDGAGNPYAVVGKAITIRAATGDTVLNDGVDGGTINFFDDGNLIGSAAIKVSGAAGSRTAGASISYKFTTKGSHTVTAAFVGDPLKYDPNTPGTQTVLVFEPTVMSISASPTWGKLGTEFTFNAVLKDSKKNPVPGELVYFKYSTSASTKFEKLTNLDSGNTDANGKISTTWKPEKNGTYYITAAFLGDDGQFYYASNAQVKITVSNVPPTGDDFNTPLWIAVILLSVGTGSYILLRKKRDF